MPGITGVQQAGAAPIANVSLSDFTKDEASTCLWQFPGIPGTSFWNDIFGSGGNLGQFCLFKKTEARAIIGAILAGAGGIFFIFGSLVAVGVAFEKTNTGKAATKAAEYITLGRGLQAVGRTGRAVNAPVTRVSYAGNRVDRSSEYSGDGVHYTNIPVSEY